MLTPHFSDRAPAGRASADGASSPKSGDEPGTPASQPKLADGRGTRASPPKADGRGARASPPKADGREAQASPAADGAAPLSLPGTEEDEHWMGLALEEARAAAEVGEIPVGAVVVQHGQLLARGHNRRELDQDPTAHAEMVALRRAAAVIGAWRLTGTTMYVTIEPCPMCAGALVLARIDRLVFGASDPKTGATGTLYNIVQDDRLNHRVEVTRGVLEDECRDVLRRFFRARRK